MNILTYKIRTLSIMTRIIFTILTMLSTSFVSFANNGLSNQLKNFQSNHATEVASLLELYADQNNFLNSLEMHQAANIASQVGEWEIAGFYYIAAPMIRALSQKSVTYYSPMSSKSKKSLRKTWRRNTDQLKSLEDNKYFKYLRKRDGITRFEKRGQLIKLKLINNLDILKKSLLLYKQWTPIINDEYHHISTYSSMKSENEVNMIFKQLNEIYIKANDDTVELLKILRYKELKLFSINDMGDISKLLESGHVDFNKLNKDSRYMKEIVKYGNGKREMEQIEIDNLLFPEIAWGSWF